MDLENCTPEELFNLYAELDKRSKTCPIEEYDQVCEERGFASFALREKGHIVAYHPKSGIFLCPKL